MEYGKDMEWIEKEPLQEINDIKIEFFSTGREILDLSMINPDLTPARVLQDKLVAACLKPLNHRYSVSRGVRRLREAFALKYARAFDAQLNAENEICITMGTKDALLQALLCLSKDGARVLLGKPTYPGHLSAVKLAKLDYDFFEMHSDPDVLLENLLSELKQKHYDVVLLNFPNNPSGIVVDDDFFDTLVKETSKSETFILNDFVYGEMGYGAYCPHSLLAGRESFNHIAEIYSMSKAYSVPGWRVAAICGDRQLVYRMAKLKSRVDYGIFLPIQLAAASALVSEEDFVSKTVETYHKRSDLFINGLLRQGWNVSKPKAGASVWAKIPESYNISSSNDFVKELLMQTGIVALPGSCFGAEYDSYLRFALVKSEEMLRDVLENLQSFHALRAAK